MILGQSTMVRKRFFKKRLEQAPSGLTEGKIENTDRDLELFWKARR